jgi:hypothetical protein
MVQRDAKTGKEHREFFSIDMTCGCETIAPSIEAKILAGAIDEAARKGHLNRIVRWAPHAAIDGIRVHDFYEEVFVAAGTLLVATPEDCAHFEAFAAPAFACRLRGSRYFSKMAGGIGR